MCVVVVVVHLNHSPHEEKKTNHRTQRYTQFRFCTVGRGDYRDTLHAYIITEGKTKKEKKGEEGVEETTFFFHPNRLYKCIYICIYI